MNAKFIISTTVFLDTPRLYQYMCFDMNNNGEHYFTDSLAVILILSSISTIIIWIYPPQIATNCFLVPLDRKFCVEYNEKKFTALNALESIFIIG